MLLQRGRIERDALCTASVVLLEVLDQRSRGADEGVRFTMTRDVLGVRTRGASVGLAVDVLEEKPPKRVPLIARELMGGVVTVASAAKVRGDRGPGAGAGTSGGGSGVGSTGEVGAGGVLGDKGGTRRLEIERESELPASAF